MCRIHHPGEQEQHVAGETEEGEFLAGGAPVGLDHYNS